MLAYRIGISTLHVQKEVGEAREGEKGDGAVPVVQVPPKKRVAAADGKRSADTRGERISHGQEGERYYNWRVMSLAQHEGDHRDRSSADEKGLNRVHRFHVEHEVSTSPYLEIYA